MRVQFEVLGTPMPQGSKKAFAVKGRAFVKESNSLGHAQWRNAVSAAAKDVATHDDITAPLTGPLSVTITYRFPMPKSRPAAARARGLAWKTTAPDTDKLDRAIGDALTAAGLIADDALICATRSLKYETTGWTGAVITIEQLAAEDAAA